MTAIERPKEIAVLDETDPYPGITIIPNLTDGNFALAYSGAERYSVDAKKATCTCPDFKFRCRGLGVLCKHLEKFCWFRRKQHAQCELSQLLVRSERPDHQVKVAGMTDDELRSVFA